MTESGFTITVYDGSIGPEPLDEALAVYCEVYAEPPYLEEERDFTAFADDLPHRAKQVNFRLVLARFGAEALGFALGHQLSATTRWWEGALRPLAADVTAEHSGRTFAIIELAVRQRHRRRGLGRSLHAHLIADSTEERTTLLVRPDAEAAQRAYSNWGYRPVGQIRPNESAPIYDAMLSAYSP